MLTMSFFIIAKSRENSDPNGVSVAPWANVCPIVNSVPVCDYSVCTRDDWVG